MVEVGKACDVVGSYWKTTNVNRINKVLNHTGWKFDNQITLWFPIESKYESLLWSVSDGTYWVENHIAAKHQLQIVDDTKHPSIIEVMLDDEMAALLSLTGEKMIRTKKITVDGLLEEHTSLSASLRNISCTFS